MDIIIRNAEVRDSEEVARLTNELGYSASENDTKEWLICLLESSDHAVIVAAMENRSLLGWVAVEKRLSLETGYKAEISGLVVSFNYRRIGAGRKLVNAAEIWAAKLGMLKIYVRSNIIREESHVFYKNIGFSHIKTAHNYEKFLQSPN